MKTTITINASTQSDKVSVESTAKGATSQASTTIRDIKRGDLPDAFVYSMGVAQGACEDPSVKHVEVEIVIRTFRKEGEG